MAERNLISDQVNMEAYARSEGNRFAQRVGVSSFDSAVSIYLSALPDHVASTINEILAVARLQGVVVGLSHANGDSEARVNDDYVTALVNSGIIALRLEERAQGEQSPVLGIDGGLD